MLGRGPLCTAIRLPELHARTKWDWKCLAGCFGRSRISPSDFDAVVERNGRFLVIETKHPNTLVDEGQAILLEQASRLPGWWVLVVWGDCPVVTSIAVVGKDDIRTGIGRPATTADLRMICEDWFRRANNFPTPRPPLSRYRRSSAVSW